MSTKFNMDARGFLQTLNKLERRFDELTSRESQRRVYENNGVNPEPLDHRLYVLAHEVFTNTGWSMDLFSAAACFDVALMDECRRFLRGSASVVRRYGLPVWLYDLMSASTLAAYTGEPSDRMPKCIRVLTPRELAIRGMAKGRKRFGTKKQRKEDVWQFVRETHRLGAFTMLKWGEQEPKSLSIARMMLTDPGIGMSMLRDDAGVDDMGAVPDYRYRRVVAYEEELMDEVGRWDAEHRDGVSATDDGCGFAAIGARYLRDAERLIEAYRQLWDTETPRSRDVLLSAGNRDGDRDMPLWQNPLTLRNLAISLLGSALSSDLIVGFEERDRRTFNRGVEQLREAMTIVGESGFAMMPRLLIDRYDPGVESLLYCSEEESETQQRLFRDLCEGMACVVLHRVTDDLPVRQMAIALIECELGQYEDLITDCETAACQK
ncbi:hypothetical protein BTIS_1988 [Bifidobacterium tissieri]|uniref:Riboflavin deaminase n=1 Tax=Bifidobacterium tissieri TaxID=1630162 RepID=A0A261F9M8_9BIFI|nr:MULTISPECIES: hypothetical protein [Bifidobacterium]OZG55616.1 hypothetical protein BTIS_1988 [Bifidobacterium tissieri]TPF97635.1 hypothetical protein EP30_01460 [Bifidobacterium sp. UTCIF-39]